MASHNDLVNAVMLGVGAAIDVLAEVEPQAPAWKRCAGLEWLFPLATKPPQLGLRYAYHDPRSVAWVARPFLTSSIL
jgi:N-acetylglucosaminyldiphosphoundecaprenol N-acetyl-beta-D-mannosaminyltransferase